MTSVATSATPTAWNCSTTTKATTATTVATSTSLATLLLTVAISTVAFRIRPTASTELIPVCFVFIFSVSCFYLFIFLISGCSRNSKQSRSCGGGSRRTLSSVLKRPVDLLDDCAGGSNSLLDQHQLINADLHQQISCSAPVSPSASCHPPPMSSGNAKRAKRSKSPTVITLSSSSKSDPLMIDDDATTMSHASTNSYPVDVTSYHRYTRKPWFGIVHNCASGSAPV